LTHPLPGDLCPQLRVRAASPPTYWRCEPGWAWSARPLTDFLLWLVLDGVGHLALGGQHHSLGSGMGVVFAPGDTPVAGHDPRRRLLIFGMHFDAAVAAGHQVTPDQVAPPGRAAEIRDPVLATALARRCDISYRRGDALGRHQSSLCLEQIIYLLRDDSREPIAGPVDQALDSIIELIRRDPTRRWTVAELAERTALSRAQFTRRFIAHAGIPPARFVIRARVERAKQLLTETDMTVTQVAATLGYTEVAHFSRQFKRQVGHSPRRPR
jgi:AraC family transcriptional regulator of arabinose operon